MLFALIITIKYTSCAAELPPKCIILLEICDGYRKLRWFHPRPWVARGMFAPRVAPMAAVVAHYRIAYASPRAFAALGGDDPATDPPSRIWPWIWRPHPRDFAAVCRWA